jgi:hypothetical protein
LESIILYKEKNLLLVKEVKMIVEVNIMYDNLEENGSRERDKVIRAIDSAMNGASWESEGDGWIARR